MNASAQRAPLTEAELVERRAFLQRLGLGPNLSAEVVPLRKPLGLGIVDDGPPESRPEDMAEDGSVILSDGVRFSFKDGATPETLAPWVNVDLLYISMNGLISTIDVSHQKAKQMGAELRSEVARIELENARLKAAVSELTAKVETLTFISERLRLENKGPAGERGPMGRDGHDGARGPRGERGAMGPAGPRPVSFDTDAEAFAVTGLMSDGRRAPTMHLRALFEAYHAQTEGEAEAAEIDAAAASRERTELEAARTRAGLPR
jgi:hypothetical protein